MKRVDATSPLIDQNFLRLTVLFDSYSSPALEEVPAMTTEVLAANIGGTMSLWMGLTTMALIELIELLYNVLSAMYRSRRASICPVDEKHPDSG